MLNINSVSLTYSGIQLAKTPDLKLSPGELISVMGPNGAGKSTLLKLITQDWKASQGDIWFQGIEIGRWNKQQLAKNLAVLPQGSRIDFPFTCYEVVSIGTTPLTLKKRKIPELVKTTMLKTDTWHLHHRQFSKLSGGEKQRVQLARVLVQLSQCELPPLLLLDEPTSAQDLGHQHHIMCLIRELCTTNKFGVLAVLHDLNLAAQYSDICWLIANGNLVLHGCPDEVLTPKNVDTYWQYQPEKLLRENQGFALI